MTNKLKYRQDFEVELLGQVFKLTCYYQSTRTGFRHLCFITHMCEGGEPSTKDYIAKCVYYNRTWEEYCYQSVLRKAATKILHELTYNIICKAMDTVQEVH